MAICKKCIIPDSFPGISMTNGVCSFCMDYQVSSDSKSEDGAYKRQILEDMFTHSKRSTYDCLVPVSGGKDSAYVLYYVVTQMKLKPLAAFFDSEFAREIARTNVKNICSKLGVDLIVVNSLHDFYRKSVIEAIHMSKSVGFFFCTCSTCENNLRSMAINESLARNIPYILWGSTDYEDAIGEYSEGYSRRKTFRQSFGHSSVVLPSLAFFGDIGFRLLYKCPQHVLRYWYYTARDNFIMNAPGGPKRLMPLFQVPFHNQQAQVIYFFNYIDYNPLHQINVLREELGWIAPSGKEARIDCRLHCLQNQAFLSRNNISVDGFNMANLIRADLMDRDEALRRENIIKESVVDDCVEILRYLKFPIRDLTHMLKKDSSDLFLSQTRMRDKIPGGFLQG